MWKTDGWVLERRGSPRARIDATDTYEWIPGGWGVLHRVDARVGDEVVEGAEIIGYDPQRRSFASQYFGSDGPTSYSARFGSEEGALTWEMESANTRFRGVFNESRDFIDGHWTLLEDGEWQPWMEITLTRRAGFRVCNRPYRPPNGRW